MRLDVLASIGVAGRLVLYSELSLTASYVLLTGFALTGHRLIRRGES